LASLVGCGKEELPKSYPVQGKVVRKDGQPYTGGVVVFDSLVRHGYQGSGEIGEDGSFTLKTIAIRSDGSSELIDGAIEGECTVSIIPPNQGRIFVLKKTYTVNPTINQDVIVNADDPK
jgi:hypothetical protein